MISLFTMNLNTVAWGITQASTRFETCFNE